MISLFDLGFSEAEQAERSGDSRRAIRLLRAMLDSGLPRGQRYRVLASLSLKYTRQGQAHLAESALAEARRCLSTLRRDDRRNITIVDLAEVRLAADAGDLLKMRCIVAQIGDKLSKTLPADPEIIAEILVELAAFQVCTSEMAGAKSLLTQIDRLLSSQEDILPELRARILTLRSQFHISTPSAIGLARSQAHAALGLALRHGLVRESWYALHTLVDHHLGSLTLGSVLAYGDYLLRVARRIGEPRPILLASLLIAATEAQLGRLAAAWARLEDCRPLCSANTVADRELLEAFVLLGMGRYGEALELATSARGDANRVGLKNSAGVSWIYQARTLKALGHSRKAVRAAFSAASLLETSSSPFHLAVAYRDLHVLTGDTSFRNRERALTSLFPAQEHLLQQIVDANDRKLLVTVDPFSGRLTARQTEIAHLIRSGCTNREIAGHLGISESTAAHHVAAVLRRLNLRARWQLIEESDYSGRAEQFHF